MTRLRNANDVREGTPVRGNAETHADIGPRSNIAIPTSALVYPLGSILDDLFADAAVVGASANLAIL